MQWFRFYSETISDPKMRRLARMANVSVAEAIGIWAIVLSLASASPRRGRLLLTEDVPVTDDDIADMAGCNVSETLQAMLHLALLKREGGAYVVTEWEKRQFKGDTSTDRVRRYRARKRGEGKIEGQKPEQMVGNTAVSGPDGPKMYGKGVAETPDVTRDETLRKRYSNAPDTDIDTETESLPPPPLTPPPHADETPPVGGGAGGGGTGAGKTKEVIVIPPEAEITALYEHLFAFPVPPLLKEQFREQLLRDPPDLIRRALRETAERRNNGKNISAPWPYAQAILNRWREEGPPPDPKNGGIRDLSAFDPNRSNSGKLSRRDPTPEEIAEWEATRSAG